MCTIDIKRTSTILCCRNGDDSVKFYRDILKLNVNHDAEWLVEFHLIDNTFHRRLSEMGVETGPIKPIWGPRGFYIFDPEGHRIE